jgi:hypothetical protein
MKRGLVALAVVATTAASSGEASAAPAESRLFFASNRTGVWQVYSVRRSGSDLVQLTWGRADTREPQPSPDGRRLLFTRSGAAWVARANGAGARRIAPVSALGRAVWSRDSKRIAVGEGGELRVADISSGRTRRLRVTGTPIGWTRDGRRILTRKVVTTLGEPELQLHSVDARTGASELIHSEPKVFTGAAFSPEASPDGRWIALVGGDDRLLRIAIGPSGRPGRVETYGPSGSRFAWRVGLRWSPNSRMLAFAATSCADALCTLNDGIRGADVRRGVWTLTNDPVIRITPAYAPSSWAPPAWTPSSDAVAYHGAAGIRLATVSGTVKTLLPFAAEGAEAADLVWVRVQRVVPTRPVERVQPLAVVSEGEVRLRRRVDELAADDDRIAFLSCNNVGVWNPGRDPTWVGSSLCPGGSAWSAGSLAFSDVGIAYVAWSPGGISQQSQAVVVRPGSVAAQLVAWAGVCCSGGRRTGTALGSMLGAGPMLVFSRWTVSCPAFDHPSCATSGGAQDVWRVHEPSWLGTCPLGISFAFTSGPCEPTATSLGPLAPIAADRQHVVVRLEGGAVDVLDASGQLVRRLGFGPGEAAAAAIDGDDLVVVVPRLLLHYSVASGVLLHSWPLPTAEVGGFCASAVRTQCATPRLRLEGARRGVAAYLLDGELHTLRLMDGRDVAVHAATAARFGSAGLFYAFEGAAPWPGRIRFVPFDRLS